MKIASITMVGQFPDGVELHVRNLKWFFNTPDYHIYIITSPEVRERIDIEDAKVTFIVKPTPEGRFAEEPLNPGFIGFWKWFPAIIKHHNIDPDWFLFMEQDLWFFEQFDSVPPLNTVKAFFAEKGSYHDVMLDDKVLQPHLWEGTHLISAGVINRAIDFKIDFGSRAKSLLDRNRQHYEKLFGGKLGLSSWTGPDTLTELSLYCALEERVGWSYVEKAVHLQGPELLVRKYPQVARGYDQELFNRAQAEIPYIDIYAAIAVYYIAGYWKDCKNIKWQNAGHHLRRDLSLIAMTAREWMTKDQYGRLLEILANPGEVPGTKPLGLS